MFSLQRILGRPEKFFGLLQSSASLGCKAATALNTMLNRPDEPPCLAKFTQARRQDKEIIRELEDMLGLVFVTPMEREDLEDIAQALYRTPKDIEKFVCRYDIVWGKVSGIDFTPGSRMLESATQLVLQMVQTLGSPTSLADIKSLDARLSKIEADASYVLLTAMRRLFAPGISPLKAIIAKELFDILIKAIEDCRHAGSTLTLSVLRNS